MSEKTPNPASKVPSEEENVTARVKLQEKTEDWFFRITVLVGLVTLVIVLTRMITMILQGKF